MKQVNPEGVASNERKEFEMRFVNKFRKPVFDQIDAEIGAGKEDKNPGEERKIVGREKAGRGDTDREQPCNLTDRFRKEERT